MKRVFLSIVALGVCALGARGMLAQGFQQPAPPAAERAAILGWLPVIQ